MFDKQFDNFLNDKLTPSDFSEIWKNAWKQDITKWKTLDNLAWISIWISSSKKIKELSYGKILISETINYRTQRPERWWLFCEQIFGPRKNYECACGKYKRIRYKWVVCDICWVEVTKSSVRRERMGHIDLYAPVTHIWFLKSVPSRIWLLLGLPVKKLEQVVYFASYIITNVYDDKKEEALRDLEDKYKVSKIELQKETQKQVNDFTIQKDKKEISVKEYNKQVSFITEKIDNLTLEFEEMRDKLKLLKVWKILWELDYRLLNEKFPHTFKWGTWSEYIKILLSRIDLEKFILEKQIELRKSTQTKHKKIFQKIKLATNLLKSGQKPEWFILNVLPIIPPDLRPMIQLDGWRFASSDLNDLYRRVINRNNRLKKLIELGAPDIILKNEKRMLQESVDMLISWDIRTNRSWFISSNKRKLKSLTDVLKGKQGRFRQNLLGKRVDYSGRSVIVVGPNLNMDECGLPKKMALILFKPFVISKLIKNEIVYNVKHAEKFIEEWNKKIWDALDEVIKWKYVLLNRAPTLHRLSIQAFKPVLIDWKAIQLHPLTCTAFNADFDWDQMAVHLPITKAAQKEAKELMVTSKNLLAPSSWEPIVTPSQDMVLGCYYLTVMNFSRTLKNQKLFNSVTDSWHAYEAWNIGIRTPIKVRIDGKILNITYGRLLFNEILPKWLPFVNETMRKNALKKILSFCFEEFGSEITAKFANDIKDLWFKYSTESWISISKSDMIIPSNKKYIIKEAEEKIKFIQKKYWKGFLTENEKYSQSINVWSNAKKVIEDEMKKFFNDKNHIFNFVDSWARWNWWQITQVCWMKWLVASPSGKTIELPIISNLKEWFFALEYFIATHWGRKWKSDTALKTAQSGYLTRRLVDAAQNIIVKKEDCGSIHYKETVRDNYLKWLQESFDDKIFWRTLFEDIKNKKWEILIKEDTLINKKVLKVINDNSINSLKIRSILTCEIEWWVCKKCYGLDLWIYDEPNIWLPVGIIAAQSIWEPGTQLTMRTFHSGWVAKEWWDITQGLSRVEELLEARLPKYKALISEIDWVVSIIHNEEATIVIIKSNELIEDEYYFWDDFETCVKQWQNIKEKQTLAKSKEWKLKILSKNSGIIKSIDNNVILTKDKEKRIVEYKLELWKNLLVKEWDFIKKWQILVGWHVDIKHLMNIAWVLASQQYIISEIKWIYSSQGQTVNSKHIELIVRQMFSRVRIIDKWSTDFFPGDIIDVITFKKENDKCIKTGKKAAIWERLLLGLTKISLFTDSWLSAASFQETVRVLVESSLSRKIDNLKELKENVIIGRLIPAGNQYRKLNWLKQDISDKIEYVNSDDFIDDNGTLEVMKHYAIEALNKKEILDN